MRWIFGIFSFLLLISGCDEKLPINFLIDNSYRSVIGHSQYFQASSYDTTGGNNDRRNYFPGDTAVILNVNGSGWIQRMWFTFDSRDPDYLRHLVLRIFWEDSTRPSVEVPVGDFFGSPFGYEHYTSEYLGTSSGGFYCYFPMPFRKSARIEIENDSDYELFALYYQIGYYLTDKPMPKDVQYFHAEWNRTIHTYGDTSIVALQTYGEGVFCGLNYNAEAHNRSLVFLEGDEAILVDNNPIPFYGTGMEDYLNSGWYFREGTYAGPYHGLLLKNDSLARISAYRHHIPDPIPFTEEFKFSLEHGHDNAEDIDLSTVAYFYQNPIRENASFIENRGQRTILKRSVPADAIQIKPANIKGEVNVKEIFREDDGVDWSQNNELAIYSVDYSPFTIEINGLEEKQYDAKLYLTASRESGLYSINQISIDLFSGAIDPKNPVEVPGLIAKNGLATIRVKPQSDSTIFLIDAIKMDPVRSYVPVWNLIGPFDNPRLSDDIRTGIDITYPPENEWNPSAIYTGKDELQLTWKKISGEPAGYGMALWKYIDPYEFVISYALTFIYSPQAKQYDLLIGSDDGIKVFVNDEEIHRFLAVRIAAPDQTRIPISLIQGWNKLLLKLENNFGGYAFYARIIDPEDELQYAYDKE